MNIKDIKNLFIDTLIPLGYGEPRLQGSFREDEVYPESFITFFIFDSQDFNFYDNKAKSKAIYFNVNFYSNNPELVNTIPEKIIEKLEAIGFIKKGNGSDILSDYPTHTGWALNFIYKEKLSIKKEE